MTKPIRGRTDNYRWHVVMIQGILLLTNIRDTRFDYRRCVYDILALAATIDEYWEIPSQTMYGLFYQKLAVMADDVLARSCSQYKVCICVIGQLELSLKMS
ncbi:hypothetical protein M408DRAFT_281740 [Serendipita vermifera MAFF 305830]|uniref:Uncharacterized protein n=1 Tax=Serendipita vermifera MAFF 305830 TaxID=933852 RepID=A0A0C3ARL6_SERVB|nr:hypothetical protein M408DRAFT_281740 [Serendipita vermifera MAFF 305830]